ncbi:glycerophosphodiester phosphodiesterase [Nocardioides piscis]|uniref:Glycerophosphodiester phosphodiesterase n=1 Tax=Nocardioides piscis TaxID=2714938 RepID=A0A6G7YFP9_9ACTN|nr:glycerophosphodiester phosphodiesterase family protein [Nocardioides piscis]QIK75471.1 glycerophosphodiester phosphodiesterase [Nocardioides piscis]
MTFDLQAHRGGAGRHQENTLAAFGDALSIGVSTLELDVHLTRDDDVVVNHDPTLADARLIRRLTRAELPPSMPLLCEVAALLERRHADPVGINLEIKYDALAASELTSRADFVCVVADAIRIDGLVERTSIQCFDWGVLQLVGLEEPRLRRNLLVSPKHLAPGSDGPSPWFGGLGVAERFVTTAAEEGFDAISPIHGHPFRGGVEDSTYVPFTTPDLVAEAHAAGLGVIPYVVDDPATMAALVGVGVDGLITNRPGRLRDVLSDLGRTLPDSFTETTPATSGASIES